MLPSRSEKYSAAKKEKQKRKSRMWIMLNVVLILFIAGIFIYFSTEGAFTGPKEEPNDSVSVEQESGDTEETVAVTSNSPVTEDKEEAAESAAENTNPKEQKTEDSSDSEAPSESTSSERDQEEPAQEETNKPAAPEKSKSIVINFAGDVQFAGKVEELLEREGFDYPYQHLGDLFHKDDLTFINLETPVTTGGEAALGKTYVYKSSPKALEAMAEAGVDAVNLANNHILDQGLGGLEDTLKFLDDYKIKYVGAGKDRKKAYSPVYYKAGGMRIALLGFTRVIPEANWRAEAGKPGVADAYDSTEAVKAIQKAKKDADLVIVMAHWGEERKITPNEHQKTLGEQFVDAGADLVIGGHPHVLQGLESYKGKWIAYSTGNFIFSRSTTEETWRTAIFQATCEKSGNCSMKLIPYHAELGQPVPMEQEDGLALLKDIEARSFGAKIGADGSVTIAD
ncbi:CapA family protein [Neobacillus mesonae]|nr:CapA family protein [Neobacillus mesonae]